MLARMRRLVPVLGLLAAAGAPGLAQEETALPAFQSAWPQGVTRTWIGPDYWADRLQDWRLHDGRIECLTAGPRRPMRAVHLLSATLSNRPEAFEVRVITGPLAHGAPPSRDVWAGFLIGAGGPHVDYRITALVHHRPAEDGGLVAAVDSTGRVAFRDNERNAVEGGWAITGPLHPDELREIPAKSREGDGFDGGPPAAVVLRLVATPTGDGYTLALSAHDAGTDRCFSRATLENVAPRLADGCVALISHSGAPRNSGWWFRDWSVEGPKLDLVPERRFGPVLATQFTVSEGVLKLCAQMPPLGPSDTKRATLELRSGEDADWRSAAEAELEEDSCTFLFRVENWNADRPASYRVRYALRTDAETTEPHVWTGTIPSEPRDAREFVVAAFTGTKHFTGGLRWNHDAIWFPHADVVRAVQAHRPDLLFFSGDQVYEGDITGAERRPLERAMLDYLDKWYRWCWAFRELARDRPCICIPDDHDVYHGNLWGAGGRAARRQDDGGYTMPPRFVKMVERTQTGHLPDPYDPTPIEQGIGVYYTRLEWGGVSFAVIEDRKFKSSPTVMVPEGKVVNGWFQNPEFDPATGADVPGAVLLGERQLRFLRQWAADWRHGAWMKVVLSQTVFANVATIPAGARSGAVLPSLPIPRPGEYLSGYRLAADADSNGWPPGGRNRALREMRRAFAFHIAGDQHLASFIHYGVDDWDDAGYALCVPSIGNTWPRRWFPPEPGANHRPDQPPYTGRYLDGFGNRMTVLAVANPVVTGREPARLHDRSPGYGIVRFRRATREIVVECWPRGIDPDRRDARQYPGWPVTVTQRENYGRAAAAHLPELHIENLDDAVVQVIDEANGEVEYTLRIPGRVFRPFVFRPGRYTVRVIDPDARKTRVLRGLEAPAGDDARMPVRW